jgi:hypothetical protein
MQSPGAPRNELKIAAVDSSISEQIFNYRCRTRIIEATRSTQKRVIPGDLIKADVC